VVLILSEEINVLLQEHKIDIIEEWKVSIGNIVQSLAARNDCSMEQLPTNINEWAENLFQAIICVNNGNLEYSTLHFGFANLHIASVDVVSAIVDNCFNIVDKYVAIDRHRGLWHLRNYVLASFATKECSNLSERLSKRDMLIDGLGVFLLLINDDMDVLWFNNIAKNYFPSLTEASSCYQTSLCRCDGPNKEKLNCRDSECQTCLCYVKEASRNILPNKIRISAEVDGKESFFELCGTRLRNDNILVLGYEISDFVRIEDRLSTSENKLNFILENNTTPMMLINSDGEIISSNSELKNFMKNYGFTNNSIDGKLFWELPGVDCVKDNSSQLRQVWEEVVEKHSCFIDFVYYTDVIHIKLTGVLDRNGEFIGALATISKDIEIAVLQDLYDNEKVLCATVMDMIEDSVIVVDSQYDIVFSNGSAQTFFSGYVNLKDSNSYLAQKLIEIIDRNHIEGNGGSITDIDDKEYLEVTVSKLPPDKTIVYIKSLYPFLTSLKQQIASREKEMRVFSSEFDKLMNKRDSI